MATKIRRNVMEIVAITSVQMTKMFVWCLQPHLQSFVNNKRGSFGKR